MICAGAGTVLLLNLLLTCNFQAAKIPTSVRMAMTQSSTPEDSLTQSTTLEDSFFDDFSTPVDHRWQRGVGLSALYPSTGHYPAGAYFWMSKSNLQYDVNLQYKHNPNSN